MGFFSKVKDLFKPGLPTSSSSSDTFNLSASAYGGDGSPNWLSMLGSFAAPAVGAGLNYAQANALMDKQMAFQQYNSDTAIQRRLADNIAAGVNPLYSMSSGQGASSPAGAMSQGGDFANALNSGIGRAFENQIKHAQIASMHYQNEVQKAAAEKGTLETDLLQKQIENYDAELAARLYMMYCQGEAALASGAASSSMSSSLQQDMLLKNLTKPEQVLYNQFIQDHPNMRNFGFFLKAIGLGGLSGSSGPKGGSFGIHR
ncbi:DNA pilot protein [Peromfec virus RodF8_40]|uniref:DNA pilot protein n=1 Tax=Peromfec virus RodF8_40 TaxID=2929374 RepID=A0A976N327_9VIRU|nr:DNA pilot protein [Peromfec virus RodF8_40]